MRYTAVAATMLVCSLVQVLPTRAQTKSIKLNGGLEAQVASIGRDKTFHELTVSITLANRGKNTIYLLLLPGVPSTGPKAQDAGITFFYMGSSGVAICGSSSTAACIGIPRIVDTETPPLQSWTELDPDTSAVTVNFQLGTSHESHGHLASFSCAFAYRAVSDPKMDDTLTETQKRERIQTMNLSLPPTPVVQEE
jgi:hypothetical protein